MVLELQVLSDTVCKAFILTGGPELYETIRFVYVFDRFFDSLNVSNFTNGKYKRKVFQQPYRSANDFRLNVNN